MYIYRCSAYLFRFFRKQLEPRIHAQVAYLYTYICNLTLRLRRSSVIFPESVVKGLTTEVVVALYK